MILAKIVTVAVCIITAAIVMLVIRKRWFLASLLVPGALIGSLVANTLWERGM